MSKVILSYRVTNLHELGVAITNLISDAAASHAPADVVLLNPTAVRLVEVVLSDGSKVYDLSIKPEMV